MRPGTTANAAGALFVGGAAAMASGLVLSGVGPARIVGGLALTLVLPGLAVHGALFPGRRLSGAERVVLTLALSLAVVVLGGLALFAAGVRLDRTSWCALTAVVTLVAALVGYVRQRRMAAEQRRTAADGTAPETPAEQPAPTRPGRPILQVMTLIMAVALLAGAGWFSLRSAHEEDSRPFTSLQMVPASADQTSGPTRMVTIGLRCEERALTHYSVQVRGPGGFQTELTATLWPGTTWARQVAVPATGKVSVELFRPGDKKAYRTTYLDGSR